MLRVILNAIFIILFVRLAVFAARLLTRGRSGEEIPPGSAAQSRRGGVAGGGSGGSGPAADGRAGGGRRRSRSRRVSQAEIVDVPFTEVPPPEAPKRT